MSDLDPDALILSEAYLGADTPKSWVEVLCAMGAHGVSDLINKWGGGHFIDEPAPHTYYASALCKEALVKCHTWCEVEANKDKFTGDTNPFASPSTDAEAAQMTFLLKEVVRRNRARTPVVVLAGASRPTTKAADRPAAYDLLVRNATALNGHVAPFNVSDRPHQDFVVAMFDALTRTPPTVERAKLADLILPDRTCKSVSHLSEKRGQVRSREALIICWALTLMLGGSFRPDAGITTEVMDQASRAYDTATAAGADCMMLPSLILSGLIPYMHQWLPLCPAQGFPEGKPELLLPGIHVLETELRKCLTPGVNLSSAVRHVLRSSEAGRLMGAACVSPAIFFSQTPKVVGEGDNVCHQWRKGSCTRGTECRFSHVEPRANKRGKLRQGKGGGGGGADPKNTQRDDAVNDAYRRGQDEANAQWHHQEPQGGDRYWNRSGGRSPSQGSSSAQPRQLDYDGPQQSYREPARDGKGGNTTRQYNK